MRPYHVASAHKSILSATNSEGARGLVLGNSYSHLINFPDPVMIVDRDERVLFLNKAAQCLFGLESERDLPLSSRDLLWLQGDEAEHGLFAECERLTCLDRAPSRVRNARGEWLPGSVTASLIESESGSIEGCLVLLRHRAGGSPVESELLHHVARLTGILENFPSPFFTVDLDLVVTHMNERMEELTGYSSSEVIGRMTCFQLLSAPLRNSPGWTLKEAMETRMPVSGVRQSIANREGKIIPVVVYASIITDSAGNVVGGFQALSDISEVVEAEQKIQLMTELTLEGILMVDEEYRIVYANSRMSELCDRPREELLGSDVRGILPLQHLEMMQELMSRADQGRQVRFCSTIQPETTTPGGLDTLETCMASVQTSNGILTCIYFRDLKAHIEAERELRKTNAFLNNIIRSSVSGIVVLDTEGRVLIFNEGAERILGYKAEEVIGHPEVFDRCYEPEIAREIMRRMRSCEDGPRGKLFTTRLSLTRKDGGTVPVSFSAALIMEGDREIGSVGIFSDLSEQVRIRRELEEARNQLLQAEKIASLGRMAAGVAHEINNPLAGILIYADLLMRDVGDDPRHMQDLQEIIDQTLRCKQIVNQLLEFSRQPLGEKVLFDLNQVIERCINLLKHQASFHDIEIVCHLDPCLIRITGDPGQVQQVLTNLIINAAAAMEGKGTITISSRNNEPFGGVILTLADNGPGVPEEIKDKIFDPFFTTKGPREGTGLGLSVVYGIIQQHGGSIRLEDAEGGGALFIISLPSEPPEGPGTI